MGKNPSGNHSCMAFERLGDDRPGVTLGDSSAG